jgi:carboxyl-terminal processing protease
MAAKVNRLAGILCTALLLSLPSAPQLALAADAPELKPLAPKVDTSTPSDKPKKLRPLMGSVRHSDKVHTAPTTSPAQKTAKLTGGAATNQSKLGVKNLLNALKGRSDDNTLKAKVKDDSLKAQANSSFGIIGVKFVLTLGRPPVINRVFPGTPAWDKGLKFDDQIVAVDGVPTMGLTKDEVYDLIIGSPGTPVALTIMRNGDFMRCTCMRMDINEIRDPMVRRDYMLHM